jgi:pilus assembly protein Flp/PilA
MRFINSVRFMIRQIVKDEAGVTAVEYGLFAALIAGVIATVVGSIGTDLNELLTNLAAYLKPA